MALFPKVSGKPQAFAISKNPGTVLLDEFFLLILM